MVNYALYKSDGYNPVQSVSSFNLFIHFLLFTWTTDQPYTNSRINFT